MIRNLGSRIAILHAVELQAVIRGSLCGCVSYLRMTNTRLIFCSGRQNMVLQILCSWYARQPRSILTCAARFSNFCAHWILCYNSKMQQYHNSIFWVETEKINPNPFQPRKEFEPRALQDLADSIRQYGVLQPLVVTRKEIEKEDGGLVVQYELIAGERRLRASKLAGLPQVPVIIRAGHEDDKMKLELAIIENLQREDLNPIDRAQAFLKLHQDFGLTHGEVGKKMGKSREYVSNTLRLLSLPQEIMDALGEKRISEGHTRPLMMLADRPAEQITLFKEIAIKKLSVREAERIARGIASEKTRKKDLNADPELIQYQNRLAETLGTRVSIEKKEVGGKIVIDYFSPADLAAILELLKSNEVKGSGHMMEKYIASSEAPSVRGGGEALRAGGVSSEQDTPQPPLVEGAATLPEIFSPELPAPTLEETQPSHMAVGEPELHSPEMLDDRTQEDKDEEDSTDLYNVNSFTI